MRLTHLGEDADTLLTDFAKNLATLGCDVPKMIYVSSGDVAWDQPSLTLYVGIADPGEPGWSSARAFLTAREVHTSISFFIQLLRHSAAMGVAGRSWMGEAIPERSDLHRDGLQAVTDVGLLVKASVLVLKAHSATGQGQSLAFGGAGPLGGMTATRIRLDMSVS